MASSLADVDEDALAQAAARGGTHLIRTSKDIRSIFWQSSRPRTDTDCSATPGSAHCSTVYSDPTFAKIAELPSARYIVVFVPCENWDQLPGALRPVSFRGCDRPDPTLVVQRARRKPKAVAPDADRAPDNETPTAAANGALTTSPPETADFLEDNCRADSASNEFLPFSRTGATQAFRTAEQESLKCGWGDQDVTLVITFGSSGCVHEVHIDDDEHGAKFDRCVVGAFSKVSVLPFRGKGVTVSKHLGANPP